MTNDTDFLLKIYEEERTQARHTEEQRATITNFVILISAAIIGFFATKGVDKNSLMLAVLLVFLGVYGAIFCSKLYERWFFHIRRSREIREHIVDLHHDTEIRELLDSAVKKHKEEYPLLYKIRLHNLWVLFNIMITVIGFVYIYLILK